MTEYHKKRPMRIEEITSGSSLTGLEPSAVATVIAGIPVADGAVRVIYQTPEGTLKERLLGRADEENIAVATTERPWSFDVTDYVKTEMGKADQLDGQRKSSVGFALTSLQRRLASSPESRHIERQGARERCNFEISEFLKL